MTESSSDEDLVHPQASDREVWDDWSEADACAIKSLFSPQTFPTADAAFDFDAIEYGFDLRTFRSQVAACSQATSQARQNIQGFSFLLSHS